MLQTLEQAPLNKTKCYNNLQDDIKHLKQFIASCGTYSNLVKQAKSKQKILDKVGIDWASVPRGALHAPSAARWCDDGNATLSQPFYAIQGERVTNVSLVKCFTLIHPHIPLHVVTPLGWPERESTITFRALTFPHLMSS